MKTLNVSRAKAQFSGIARRVIKNRETVIVKTPAGRADVPFDVPDFVPPAGRGEIQLTKREIVGTKKQPAEAAKSHQVILNGADGLDFPRLVNCALVYQVRRKSRVCGTKGRSPGRRSYETT